LTTAINYTNGPPHIGHAYEGVVSDIIVRYHRVFGRDTFFLTGTDEHGQKIADTAADKGLARPKDLCDEMVPIFKELNEKLNVQPDHFVRTTHDYHYRLAQEMFRRSKSNGDIYLGEYSGWYNPREECYVTETEAMTTDFKDPVSGKPYEKKCEKSYFFKMGNIRRGCCSISAITRSSCARRSTTI
jgi:methionyl-tRNA synthetase